MRLFKLDPLVVIAVVVGLGAVVTSTAQARQPDNVAPLHVRGAQLVLQPVQSVIEDLDVNWSQEADRFMPMGAAFFSDDGLALNPQRRDQDAALSLGWQPLARPEQVRAVAPLDAQPRPGVYLRLQRRW